MPVVEPRGAVRVRFVGKTHVIDINGPNICRILTKQKLMSLINRIDPMCCVPMRTQITHLIKYQKVNLLLAA